LTVKSRRKASSSGVPKVLSRGCACGRSRLLVGLGHGGFLLRQLLLRELPTERRDLDRLRPELHVHQPEAAADDPAVAEEALDLVRVRGGPDVEVLRPPSEQQIAHAAADEERPVLVLVEPRQHLQRVRVDHRSRDRMVGARDDRRRGHLETGILSSPRQTRCNLLLRRWLRSAVSPWPV
jgi:hypothetical protein